MAAFFCLVQGCHPAARREEGPSAKLVVLVTIPPYIEIVQEIAGENVEVISVVPSKYNPHIFEPTPHQVDKMYRASLWIRVGMPYEKRWKKRLNALPDSVTVVDISKKVPLLSTDQYGQAVNRVEGKSVRRESKDLHFWMSPKRLKEQATLVAESLIALQPCYQERYRKGLAQYVEKIEQLDREIASWLSPYRGEAIIGSHGALGYFCHDYHLVHMMVEDEGKQPSPKRIERFLKEASHLKIRCVFTYPGHQNRGALMIAKRLKVPHYEIDPLEPHLLSMIRSMASCIAGQT